MTKEKFSQTTRPHSLQIQCHLWIGQSPTLRGHQRNIYDAFNEVHPFTSRLHLQINLRLDLWVLQLKIGLINNDTNEVFWPFLNCLQSFEVPSCHHQTQESHTRFLLLFALPDKTVQLQLSGGKLRREPATRCFNSSLAASPIPLTVRFTR